MQDFDWIRRVFIGFFGSATTVVLDEVNTILGLIVGSLTILYLIQQIRLSRINHQRAEFEYQQGIIDRKCSGDPVTCQFKKKINATDKD